jgi:LruC domain-containing protein
MKKFYGMIFAGLTLYSSQDSNSVAPGTQGEFDYHSTHDVNVSAFFTDTQGNYLTQVPFEVSTSASFDSAFVMARVSTGTSGHDQLSLNIPTAVDTLFVRVNYHGVPSRWKVPVGDGEVNWNLATTINEPFIANKADGTSGGRVEALPYTINYIGTWDNVGRPNYLEPVGDVIDAALLSRINASLPEYKKLPISNPDYITASDKSIEITANADVWVTFISEGAGYLNALGYYAYDKNSPPKTAADLKNVTVIFPNASFAGSGGNLRSGDKVHLGVFAPGQMIGWVLFSNGFGGKIVNPGSWTLYSTQALNSFITDPLLRQQNVLLNDPGFGRTILAFEDIRRDNGSCDQDFNDVIFSVTSNPITAINTQPFSNLETPQDADSDGVTDKLDAYPTDPARAYNQYFPAQNTFNTLAYEDLWPSRGDYDFNDLVMNYKVQQVLNAANNVVDVKMTYQLQAVGGSNRIGFAVQLPISSNNLKQATMSPAYSGTSTVVSAAESGQLKLVFPLFDDAHHVIKSSAGSFTNTVLNDTYINPTVFSLNITFNSPVLQSQLGSAPYNSFIYVNDRSVEVHLPNQAPTDKADITLFGQHADRSKPAHGVYYLTNDNKPWGLLIPGIFDYPAEKQSIEVAYNYFDSWALSKGAQQKDWYTNGNGYRNSSKIYSH